MGSMMIPEEVATMAGGPEPIGPPGEPPMGAARWVARRWEARRWARRPVAADCPPSLRVFSAAEDRAEAPPEGPPEEGGGGSEVDILSEALEVLMEYLTVASDDIEKSKAMKAAGIVQELLASNQKEQETGGGDRAGAEGHG